MDVVSACRLPVGSVVWQPTPGVFALTVVCKATYRVEAGGLTLLPDHEPPLAADVYWNADPRCSLRAATDLVPLKENVDVVVVGHAFAPRGSRVAHLVARLQVGDIDKSLDVRGDRRELGADSTRHEGAEFERMPLLYERAVGGPGTANPVGLPRAAELGAPLPNLEVAASARSRHGQPALASFGPLAPSWAVRRQWLGRNASWTSDDLFAQALPADLGPAYFNHAPPDQQLASLRDGEVVTLEHLHPAHAVVRFELPSVHPSIVVERNASHDATASDSPPMRIDTVSIDTDQATCSITWRALVPLEGPLDAGRVVVLFEPGEALVATAVFRDEARARPDLPFRSVRDDAPERPSRQPPPAPIPPPAPPPAPPLPLPPPSASASGARDEGIPEGGGATIEFAIPESIAHPALVPATPAASASTPDLERPSAPPRPPPEPPPWVTPPAPPKPSAVGAPPLPDGPWIGEVRHVPPPLTIGQRAAVVSAPSVAPVAPVAPASAPGPSVAEPPRALRRGAQLEKGEVLQLLWHEPAVVPRARRVRPFRDILDELEQRARHTELDEVTTGVDPMTVEDRRDVFEILARGAATADDRLAEELADAAVDHDKFVPSLVLVSGELVMTFDELAMLKALVTVATPLALGDEPLKAALQDARDFLAMPDLISPASVVEAMSTRIIETFRKSKRGLAPTYLESHAERALLERRSYQRREVFGEPHLRAMLQVGAAGRSVPAYLPVALASKLPMFSRFRVRALAELHLPEDHADTHVAALRVLALGRVATLTVPSEARSR